MYHHKQKVIRIHAYFGQLCKTLVIDRGQSFDKNFLETLRNLGIHSHPEKYVMRLLNGGVVESNEALMHEDRVMILPQQDVLNNAAAEAVQIKTELMNRDPQVAGEKGALLEAINSVHMGNFKEIFKNYEEQQEQKKKEERQSTAKPQDKASVIHKGSRGGGATLCLKSQIQYKKLLKKRIKPNGAPTENAQQATKDEKVKIEEAFHDDVCSKPWLLDRKESELCFESLVKKLDYDSLEVILYKNQVTDYHKLIELINVWCCGIGFLVKLKRSPKLNADGSQTLRLYCQSYKKNEVYSCPFAMTFKQDEKTGCWLMYQEYTEASMRHSHRLEKRRYDSIRDYVQEYQEKVRSLGELKDLVYSKFGLEYTLNQITYFKGKWTGEAVVVEKETNAEGECANLVRLLRKNAQTDGDFLDTDFSPENQLQFLFYSSSKMKEAFLRSSDLVFVNKRFTQNRFKRPLLMFFTVSNTGKSQLIAFALVEKEEPNFFTRAAQCFLKHMNNTQPQTVIIERHLKLYNSFKECLPDASILFCYFHIQRTLKQHFQFLEKDRQDEYQRIVELPMIESKTAFEQQLEDVNQIQFDNDYYKLIIQKLVNEKNQWPKWVHLQCFTGGASVCQRNEQIKTYLKSALKKRDCTISEVLKRMVTIEQRDFKLSNEYQKVSQKHEQVFKQANYLNSVVRDQFTMYAYLRVKWNIARGFRFEVRESAGDQFVLALKQSNAANRKPWQPEAITVTKSIGTDGRSTGVCECQEQVHSGFPCPHLCLLNYKGKIDVLDINPRWRKSKDCKGTVDKRSMVKTSSEPVPPNNTQVVEIVVVPDGEPAELDVGQFIKNVPAAPQVESQELAPPTEEEAKVESKSPQPKAKKDAEESGAETDEDMDDKTSEQKSTKFGGIKRKQKATEKAHSKKVAA